MKLGTLLLRNAAIGLAQLEAALRNQVLYGGRLGTNLVELGFMDLELLASYLSELTGFPVATPSMLDEADPALLSRIGADHAHRLRALPLGYAEDGGAISVAMVDPTDQHATDELVATFGAKVAPFVVPELRALYYLERHFGTPRRARFIRTARAGSEPGVDDRRRSQPAGGIAMPPTLTLEPRRRRSSSGMSDPQSHAVPAAIGYGAACERLDLAASRDQIVDTILEYAKGRCDALVVLLIRDGNALGWRGYVAPPARIARPIEELSLPLGGASALQAAHDAGQMFVGPPPSPAKPIEAMLWSALGSEAPSDVLVVPVLVKQRTVNLIYAHTLGGPPPRNLASELLDLAGRAQTAYLRLIRQTRGS